MDVGMADSRGRAASALRRMSERWRHRDDAGFSLIECVVAVALLVIVLVPTTIFVIEGESAASQAHLESEATTLADQALNGLLGVTDVAGQQIGGLRLVDSVRKGIGVQQPVAVADGWNTGHIRINAITKALRPLQKLHSGNAEFHVSPCFLFEIPLLSR